MQRLLQLLPALSAHTGQSLQPQDLTPISGGSINQVYHVAKDPQQPFVVKVNSATKFPQLFEREAEGLALLRSHIRVPQVIGLGEEEGLQFLLLEWIAATSPSTLFWKAFGAALAHLHSVKSSAFGNTGHNYMGAVPQDNTPGSEWVHFFATRRLRPLAQRCAEEGLLGKKELGQLDHLCSHLSRVFSAAEPSLLHGDLWSGNFLCGRNAGPVLIDPAVYYGHPAVDLGMTTLFGGFPPLFYEAYHYHAPLPSCHKDEWELCNLYPLLVHLLLFGSGYLPSIKRTLDRFAGTQF